MSDSGKITVDQALEAALGHHRSGRYAEAEQIYARIANAAPQLPDAFHLWGLSLHQRGENLRALQLIQKAISLAPQIANFHNSLGAVLAALGRHPEAVAAYKQGIERNPNSVEAYNNMGISLRVLKEYDEAILTLEEALRLKPQYHEAHNNLAICYVARGELDKGAEHYQAALEINPQFEAALNNLGNARQQQGRIREALQHHRAALEIRADYLDAYNNLLYCLLHDPDVNPAELRAEHVRWAEQFAANRIRVLPPDVNRNPNKPLYIGYVSPDFRNHAVAHFIVPVLTRHDRSQFQAFCYAEIPASDGVTQQLQTFVRGWRSTMGRTDLEVARQIAHDRIDILVDLAGHTARNRLLAFAHKPAPVQVSYLGYPATTGLSEIDYYLTDDLLDPPGTDQFYTESLFRLPGLFCCYQPHGNAADVNESPAKQRGYVTFGSLHKLARLTEEVIDTWVRLLKECPTSRLYLFRDTLQRETRDAVRQMFVDKGIAADRLTLQSELAQDETHLEKYYEVDILLDAFPWSGHTTACEALWMGVPVVTLMGQTHAGRMVADVLTHIGRTEWVAESIDDYVRVARQLADDTDALAEMRKEQRNEIARSALCDTNEFTTKIERAYREMWQQHCAAHRQ